MASKVVNELTLKLNADMAELKKELAKARGQLTQFQKNVKSIGDSIKGAFAIGAIIAAGRSIKNFFDESAQLADTQLKAQAKVAQAIKTTGGAAGYSSNELYKMASAMQDMTTFGDENILENATTQLLTFTNVAGNEFERAQMVAMDLSTVLKTDLKSSAIQVGKALNDPIKGLTGLSKSGIQFSDGQKAVIKNLVKTGQTAKAQQVILAELEKQYGGQAKRMAETGLGPLEQLKNSWGDFKEEIGKVLIPIINKFAKIASEGIKTFIEWTKKAVVWTLDWINQWIDLYNESLTFRIAVSAIGTAFKSIWAVVKFVLGGIWDALKTIGKTLVYVFSPKNWGDGFLKGLNDIILKNVTNTIQSTKDLGSDIGDAFTDGISEAIHGKKEHITLNDMILGGAGDEIIQQANEFGQEIKKSILKAIKLDGETGGKIVPIDIEAMDQALQAGNEKMTGYIENIRAGIIDMSKEFQSLANDSIAAFAVGIGEALVTGSQGIGAALSSMMSLLLDFAITFGKQMIAFGTAAIALESLFENPFLAIPAGIALIALASAVKKFMSNGPLGKFAMGGIVPGYSYAGDRVPIMANSGEMILNAGQQASLFKQINGGGAGSGGVLTARISGNDLLILLEKAQRHKGLSY